jgi:hypothetical protein
MEEQTQEMERGKQKSLDELQQELEDAKKEAKKNSRFRVIMPGKTAILNFTGRVFERTAQINDSEVTKLDFELAEKTPDGIPKVFSVGSKSATARALVVLLKAGKLMVSISREGEGLATRYRVSEVEQ